MHRNPPGRTRTRSARARHPAACQASARPCVCRWRTGYIPARERRQSSRQANDAAGRTACTEHGAVRHCLPTCTPGRPPRRSRRDTVDMQKLSIEALARQQMKLAATAGGRHTADTVYGGHEKVLRQTVIGMIAGARLAEHENPGEATVLILSGLATREAVRGAQSPT